MPVPSGQTADADVRPSSSCDPLGGDANAGASRRARRATPLVRAACSATYSAALGPLRVTPAHCSQYQRSSSSGGSRATSCWQDLHIPFACPASVLLELGGHDARDLLVREQPGDAVADADRRGLGDDSLDVGGLLLAGADDATSLRRQPALGVSDDEVRGIVMAATDEVERGGISGEGGIEGRHPARSVRGKDLLSFAHDLADPLSLDEAEPASSKVTSGRRRSGRGTGS